MQPLRKGVKGLPVPWIIHKDPTLCIFVELSSDSFVIRLASHVEEVEAHVMLQHINCLDTIVNAYGGNVLANKFALAEAAVVKAGVLILRFG